MDYLTVVVPDLALMGAGALIISFLIWLASRRPKRDARRMFTPAERGIIFERCGHRCEHKPLLWSRCKALADHADHIHPWSRGGLSDVDNAQGLCAKHNLSKGAKVPSPFYRWRLHRRRRRYFPADAPTRPTRDRAWSRGTHLRTRT